MPTGHISKQVVQQGQKHPGSGKREVRLIGAPLHPRWMVAFKVFRGRVGDTGTGKGLSVIRCIHSDSFMF